MELELLIFCFIRKQDNK